MMSFRDKYAVSGFKITKEGYRERESMRQG